MDLFLYDNGLCHERVKREMPRIKLIAACYHDLEYTGGILKYFLNIGSRP